MTNEPTDLPEGPLDPFDDGVHLASGPDDVGFLRIPNTGARLLSSLIDVIFVAILVVVPSTVIPVMMLHPAKGQKFTPAQNRTITIITLVVVLVVMLAYVALERTTGGSPGRRLFRLRLVTVAGAKPSWGRLIGKYSVIFLSALLPILILVVLLALVVATFQPQRRNGLDLMAGTRVVIA